MEGQPEQSTLDRFGAACRPAVLGRRQGKSCHSLVRTTKIACEPNVVIAVMEGLEPATLLLQKAIRLNFLCTELWHCVDGMTDLGPIADTAKDKEAWSPSQPRVAARFPQRCGIMLACAPAREAMRRASEARDGSRWRASTQNARPAHSARAETVRSTVHFPEAAETMTVTRVLHLRLPLPHWRLIRAWGNRPAQTAELAGALSH